MKIIGKHQDIPEHVFENLPRFLNDPRYAFPHQDGGVDFAIRVETENNEPIVVDIRDGVVRTITPMQNHAESKR